MSKGLEALKEAKDRNGLPLNQNFAPITEKEIAIIEKELKALEIIRNKNISIECLKRAIRKEGLEWYNRLCPYQLEKLTQEEFDLLKEVLK